MEIHCKTLDVFTLPGRAQTSRPFPFDLMWMSVNEVLKDLLVEISFCGRNRFSFKPAAHKMWDRSGREGLGIALISHSSPLAAQPGQLQEQQMFEIS